MANIGQELLAVPFPEMVMKMGVGIARAQWELDQVSVEIARMMSGTMTVYDDDGNKTEQDYRVEFGGQEYSLIELGFTPTFYQFVDTIIEVKMSISMVREATRTVTRRSGRVGAGWLGTAGGAYASSVSASYASKYQYSAEGSSLLRTKLVPVPPPAVLTERIRALAATPRTPPATGGSGG